MSRDINRQSSISVRGCLVANSWLEYIRYEQLAMWMVVILEWTGIEDATCLIWFLKNQIAGASYFISNAKVVHLL